MKPYELDEEKLRALGDENHQFFDELRTGAGIWDMGKLLSKVDFALNVLRHSNLSYRLYQMDVAARRLPGLNRQIHHVMVAYSTPDYTDLRNSLVILNGQKQSVPHWALLARLAPFLVDHLPERYGPSFDWENLRDLMDYGNPERSHRFAEQVSWEIYRTATQDYYVYINEIPGPLCFACRQDESGSLAIGGIGASRDEFLRTLESVIALQPDDTQFLDEIESLLLRVKNVKPGTLTDM